MTAELLPEAESFLASDLQLLIGGEGLPSRLGATFDVEDPSSAGRLTGASRAKVGDVDAAVRSAREAFDGGIWRNTSPAHKEKILRKLGGLIVDHLDELAQLESLDSGKPIWLSRQEVGMAADAVFYYAGWPTKLQGETSGLSPDLFAYATREPVGVCGAIIPWNFPLLMAVWKVAPAVAFRNTVVLKPASKRRSRPCSSRSSVSKPAFRPGS